jgi:glycosyltransferase involved in cell wall biosynthesis
MSLMLILLFALVAVIEIIALRYLPGIRRWQTDTLSVLSLLITTAILYCDFNILSSIIGLLTIYRVINLERLTHRKHQDDHIYHLARRSSLVLSGLQLAALCCLLLVQSMSLNPNVWLIGLAALDILGAVVLALTIDRQGRVTLAPNNLTGRAGLDMPALTVAIPARNETADLEACLQTLVKSSYLKLEILVLDDCSQNLHTPEIIRQFAHDGVRFIAGSVPPDNWLAKNFAYKQLLDESNGELVLFCGVDARFEPNALTAIVETMLDRRKTMLSVMPRNLVPARFKLEALLVQPGRYAWELALPRRWLDRPPVLSSCWVAQRHMLNEAGGFAAVTRAILPERYFARYAALHHDGYSFLQSGEQLGLASAKGFDEQRATAVRMRYPSLHRRIELTALVSIVECLLLVWPYIGLVDSLIRRQWSFACIDASSCLMLSYTYSQIVRITYQRPLLRALWLFPFAAIYDVALLNYSLWRYEFDEVIWKGRNVCIPVMRVLPHLPSLIEPNSQALIKHSQRHDRRRHHSRQ